MAVPGLRRDGVGRLAVGGARYLLVRPETLVAVHKAVEAALGPRAAECLVVTVAGSPFAEAYGPAAGPVCHLTRGVLESLAAGVLARPRPVVEEACAAAGAARCRFRTVPA